MFIDHVEIEVASGKGGDGCVSFHREKFIAKGGPDGGDGGRGGDLVLVVDEHRTNLLDFKWSRVFRAENGQPGKGGKQTGRRGKDALIKVPLGTQVKDQATGELLVDMIRLGQRVVLFNGGHGGKGNWRFRSSTNQAPREFTSGGPNHERTLVLELKILADVGLVGFPNAGKSTLLATVSAARPKIADYPFTTLVPNIGIVPYAQYKSFAMADIPGLIEGAHEGRGLGHQFLRHVERTRLLLYLVDVSAEDPQKELDILRRELATYAPELAARPSLVVLTKSDITTPSKRGLKMDHDFLISAVAQRNVKSLVRAIGLMLEQMERENPRELYAAPEPPPHEEEDGEPDPGSDD
jgi:GTP-binding protein